MGKYCVVWFSSLVCVNRTSSAALSILVSQLFHLPTPCSHAPPHQQRHTAPPTCRQGLLLAACTHARTHVRARAHTHAYVYAPLHMTLRTSITATATHGGIECVLSCRHSRATENINRGAWREIWGRQTYKEALQCCPASKCRRPS